MALAAIGGGLLAQAILLDAAHAGLAYEPVAGVWPEPQTLPAAPPPLTEFVAGVLQEQLDTSYVPGAAVAIVRDGKIALLGGYGLADRERNIPVDPQRTLFRIGSVSKVVTATAVMQLVETGQLDLSADVNSYLAEPVLPATFAAPVTLRHLITHTAGLEGNSYGYTAARPSFSPARAVDVLLQHRPARIHPPVADFSRGETAAYTNWGPALAGHVVERIARMPFEAYMEQRVFGPLGMRRSTYRQPLPEAWRDDMAQSYAVSVAPDGTPTYRMVPFEYFPAVAPAGSICSTAEDMARFMLAQLEDGADGAPRILKADTLRLLQGRVLSPHPQVNGGAYAFQEKHLGGRRAIWHSGSTIAFYSELYLMPAERAGVFVTYNSQPPAKYMGELMRRFVETYFPSTLPALTPPPDARRRAQRFAGHYAPTVGSFTTWEKRFRLSATAEVTATDAGLRFRGADWIEVPGRPAVFRRVDRGDTLAFAHGVEGRMQLFGEEAFVPYLRLPLYETAAFDRFFQRFCVLAFVAAILAALIARLRGDGAPAFRGVRWLAALLGVVNLAVLATLERAVRWDVYDMLVELPWPVTAMMTLACVSAALTALLLALVVVGWFRTDWTARTRLGYSALTLLAAAFVWWLDFWNLLGFRVA